MHYDMPIVGAEPAGLAAAVYAASGGLATLVSRSTSRVAQASYTSFRAVEGGPGGAVRRLSEDVQPRLLEPVGRTGR